MAVLAHLESHIALWRLTLDGEPFETLSSWLAYVRRGDECAVLKVYKPGGNEAPGARYLTLHKGRGAVRVLDSDDDAALIERIAPGTSLSVLSAAGRDDEACHIVCDIIEKLQQSRAAPAGWPGHGEHLEQFDRHQAVAPLTTRIAARARAMFVEFDASERRRVLLHGDLHHGNILLDDARGWLVIDPKGEVGEVAYELAAPLRHPLESPQIFLTPEQMDRRVRIYCERLGVDRKRVLGWCFARNCSAALWYAAHVPEPERVKFWPSATLSALKLLEG